MKRSAEAIHDSARSDCRAVREVLTTATLSFGLSGNGRQSDKHENRQSQVRKPVASRSRVAAVEKWKREAQ